MARVPPHLTLVPPVNVRIEDVEAAERVMRAAARATRPFTVTLGPVTTFLPVNPVAYLAVGEGAEKVNALRNAVFEPPLARKLTYDYVPHVTLADGIEPERVAAAPAVLRPYPRDVEITAIHLLEERGRVWQVLRAFPLGEPRVVGRGGDPLELEVLDIDDTVHIAARRDDEEVGALRGWRRDGYAWLASINVLEDRRREGVGSHLLAAFQSWAADAGATHAEVDPSCELDVATTAFLAARGWRADAPRPRRAL